MRIFFALFGASSGFLLQNPTGGTKTRSDACCKCWRHVTGHGGHDRDPETGGSALWRSCFVANAQADPPKAGSNATNDDTASDVAAKDTSAENTITTNTVGGTSTEANAVTTGVAKTTGRGEYYFIAGTGSNVKKNNYEGTWTRGQHVCPPSPDLFVFCEPSSMKTACAAEDADPQTNGDVKVTQPWKTDGQEEQYGGCVPGPLA